MSMRGTETRRSDAMRRRSVVKLAAGTIPLVLAGCLSDDGEATDDGPETDGADEVDGTDDGAVTDPPDDGDDDPHRERDDTGRDDNGDGDPELPVTGEAVPALAPLDEAMLEYMDNLDLTAGALGVVRDGELVLERGYGWADADRTAATPPDALFRIGSISKTFTSAAIHRLVREDELDYDDAVLSLLDVDPPSGDPDDDRFDEITVQHLLDHRGGLTPAGTPEDPVFDIRGIVEIFELDRRPTREDVIRYILDRPLETDPGSAEAYSNAGFVLLGGVIETVSDTGYQAYLEEHILPATDDIGVASADPDDRHPREVHYRSRETVPTALAPGSDEEVPIADGGFLLAPIAPAGGHYAATHALLSFMQEYWVFTGEPRSDEAFDLAAAGSIPGTFAFAHQRSDGIDLVCLFNGRDLVASGRIADRLDAAIEDVDEWPA